jgi:cytohesin
MREVDAAVCGEFELLKSLSPELVDDALIAAAAGGRTQIMALVLTQWRALGPRFTVPVSPHSGIFSALWRASAGGHTEIVRMLSDLSVGSVNETDQKSGATPLWIASQNGHAETVTALLEAGASTDLACDVCTNPGCRWAGKSESTALHAAAEGGHARVIDALLLAGGDVDNRIKEGGKTALHQAAETGQITACAALLKGGAKVDAVCASGCSALFYATNMKKIRVVGCLLSAGASIDLAEKRLADGGNCVGYRGGSSGGRQLVLAG